MKGWELIWLGLKNLNKEVFIRIFDDTANIDEDAIIISGIIEVTIETREYLMSSGLVEVEEFIQTDKVVLLNTEII